MIFKGLNNKNEDESLEKLGMAVGAFVKPALSEERKDALKKRILNQLRGEEKLNFSLARLFGQVVLNVQEKARIKEAIFERIEQMSQPGFFWSRLFLFHKKFVSLAVLFAMFFGMFVFTNVDTNVVKASQFTVLEKFDGDVFIERDGKKIEAYHGFVLREQDHVVTGDDGFAVVRYFDDSVNRLSENGEIVISKLFKPDDSVISSYVEVSLLDGQLWSKVVNLVDEKSFFSVNANGVYAKAKKAAFDVKVVDDAVEIQVFNRQVQVYEGKKEDKKTDILSGQKVLVADENIRVAPIPESEKKAQWVEQNLDSDRQYVKKVEGEIIEENKKIAEENGEPGLREKALLFFTVDEISKKKIELDIAEKALIAAEAKLSEGGGMQEKVFAKKSVDDFAQEVKDFYGIIDQVAYTDPDYAKELRKYVEEKTLAHKKDLSVVMPGSPLYNVKETLGSLDVLKANNEEELKQIQTDKVLDKLSEVEDLVVNEDSVAEDVAEEYVETAKSAIEMVNSDETLRTQVSNYVDILVDIDPSTGQQLNLQPQKEEVSGTTSQTETIYGGVKVMDGKILPPGF